MLKVGLTGGIGSGKTTVTELFSKLGAPIIDADLIAKELTEPGHPAYLKIIEKFGEYILLPNGELNRKKLRDEIFSDAEQKKWLEALLHPLIKKSIDLATVNIDFPYCLIAIPLLIETASFDLVDRVLVIETSIELQIARTIARDLVSEDHVHGIIKAQASSAQRLEAADEIIYNHGNLTELAEQVQQLHQYYLDFECE